MCPWYLTCGQDVAHQLRRQRPRPGDTWHLDEVFRTINGARHDLWRAVEQDGTGRDSLVQPRRHKKAATQCVRTLLNGCHDVPRVRVTDQTNVAFDRNRQIERSEDQMTKALLTALLVMLPLVAMAEIDYGQLCWTTNFADSFRLWVTQEGDAEISIPNGDPLAEPMFAIKSMLMNGPTDYRLAGAGSAHPSYPVKGMYTLSAHLEQRSPNFWFNGNRSCVFEGSIDAKTLGGTWRMVCGIQEVPGLPTPSIIRGTMTFAPDCELLVPLVNMTRTQMRAQGLRLAGESGE
jgi:hypothetical protein